MDDKILFETIERGDLDVVKKYIEDHPTQKRALNIRGQSAVKKAVELNKFEIYQFLVENGFEIDIVDKKPEFRRKLEKESMNELEDYLLVLRARTRISEAGEDHEYTIISKFYQRLNQITLIRPILKLVAHCEDVLIIFCSHLKKGEPFLKDSMKNSIIVEVKNFKDESSYLNVLAKLAHELCHYAMNLVYNNDAKPYFFEDKKSKEKFEEIAHDCYNQDHDEETIRNVFENFPYGLHHTELIVQVPYFLALDMKNPEKLLSCQRKFEKLFDFFANFVIPDVELETLQRKLQIALDRKLIKIYSKLEDFRIFSKHESFLIDFFDKTIIKSNCPMLTMKEIKSKFKSHAFFVPIKTVNLLEIFEILKEIFENFETNFDKTKLVVDCSEETDGNETAKIAEKLKTTFKEAVVIFIVSESLSLEVFEDSLIISMKHFWSQLTQESQDSLMMEKITFQGEKVALKDLLTSKNFPALNLISLNDIFQGIPIKIGKKLEFEEKEFHIERKFYSSDDDIEKSFEEIMNLAQIARPILISDEPGMGKSLELVMASTRLKTVFPFHWVSYIIPRDHIRDFEKESEMTKRFEVGKEISDFFSEKILNLSVFEAKVFEELFNSNRVIILIDGFDEISPLYKTFVITLLKGITKVSKNQLWVTTRPHLTNFLKFELNTEAYKLNRFTEQDAKWFYDNYLTIINVENNSRQAPVYKMAKFLNYSNPLLLQMLADIIGHDTNPDVFEIYDRMNSNLFTRCKKSGTTSLYYLSSTSDFSIIKCFQKYSFFEIFRRGPKQWTDACIDRMINVVFPYTDSPTNEDIARLAIMFCDDSMNFHFIHRSFAEYFVAEFLYQQVFLQRFIDTKKIQLVLEVFAIILMEENEFKIILTFIDKALENFNISFVTQQEITKTCFDQVLKEKPFVESLIRGGFINIIRVILFFSVKNSGEFYRAQEINGISLFKVAVTCQTADFVEKFIDLLMKILPQKEQQNLLRIPKIEPTALQQSTDDNIFMKALKNEDFRVLEVLISFAKSILPVNKMRVALMSKSSRNRSFFLESSALNGPNFTKIFQIFNDFFTSDELKEILISVDENGWNIVHHTACFSHDPETLKTCLEALKVIFSTEDVKNVVFSLTNSMQNVLMLAASNYSSNVLKTIWSFSQEMLSVEEIRHVITRCDDHELILLDYAIQSDNPENVEFVLSIYKTIFSLKHVEKILILKNKYGENVLQRCLQDSRELVVKPLLEFMAALFDENQLKVILKSSK